MCSGRLTDNCDWVFVEDPGSKSQEPAVVEPVKSLGELVPVEVFVKRFL
jgi:hypothetical protein